MRRPVIPQRNTEAGRPENMDTWTPPPPSASPWNSSKTTTSDSPETPARSELGVRWLDTAFGSVGLTTDERTDEPSSRLVKDGVEPPHSKEGSERCNSFGSFAGGRRH